MEPLRIGLFGTLRLSRGNESLRDFPTQRCGSLFSYLAVNRQRRHARAVLAGVFWGELPESVARKRLRTDIWRIRTVVEPAGIPRGTIVAADSNDVGLNRAGWAWLDIDEFEERVRRIPSPNDSLTPTDFESLARAVDLYQGDLLEGNYDDWCLYERERLKAMFHQALHRLIAHRAARREFDEAIVYARELLRRDPLQEQVHRQLMRFYYLTGNRPGALEQFATLKRMLDRELGVAPMVETVALYEAIRDDDSEKIRSTAADPALTPRSQVERSQTTRPSVLEELTAAKRELDSAGERVRRSIADLSPRLSSTHVDRPIA